MKPIEVFWVVWNPCGGAPTVRHRVFEDARREAKRLARETPDQQFFVLKSVGCAQRETVSWVELNGGGRLDDCIPF